MSRKIFALVWCCLMLIALILTSCLPVEKDTISSGEEDQATTPTEEGTEPTNLEASPLKSLLYPWDGMNMFFGWSIIGKDKISYAEELDMKWASLQPQVIWFDIEQEKGKYE